MSNLQPDFGKYENGLVPAIVQDAETRVVLMLGYMNRDALDITLSTGKVTFFSRSRQQLWTKGATSGNFLGLISICTDCDRDTLLVLASPAGPVCHTGNDTCFGQVNKEPAFLPELEAVIASRISCSDAGSYVASLYAQGINKIAQKVGEESVELIIEAKDNDMLLFKNEAADLLFHYLILLQAKGIRLKDVTDVLESRHAR